MVKELSSLQSRQPTVQGYSAVESAEVLMMLRIEVGSRSCRTSLATTQKRRKGYFGVNNYVRR